MVIGAVVIITGRTPLVLSLYFQPLCQAKDPQPPLAPPIISGLCSSDHGFLGMCARLYLYDDIKSLSKSSEFSIARAQHTDVEAEAQTS